MFFFDSYQVRDGKYNIPGLPAFFSSEKSEGETLEIVLKDTVEEVYVHLLYGVFEELDIITRAAVVENRTEGDIQISRIMSACLDLGMGKYDLIHFMENMPVSVRWKETVCHTASRSFAVPVELPATSIILCDSCG